MCVYPSFSRLYFFVVVFLPFYYFFSSRTPTVWLSLTKSFCFWGFRPADPVPRLYPWTSIPRTSNPLPFAYSKYATRCDVKKYTGFRQSRQDAQISGHRQNGTLQQKLRNQTACSVTRALRLCQQLF